MSMAIEKAEHSRIIASNQTHSLWERWDGCQVVDRNGSQRTGLEDRRTWCFYPRGTFVLGIVSGFEWAREGETWVNEPVDDERTNVPFSSTSGPWVDDSDERTGPTAAQVREAYGKGDPYTSPLHCQSAQFTDAQTRFLTDQRPSQVEARKRLVAALAADMGRPVTPPRFPSPGRDDRVAGYRRWSDKS
jgi:hypothetical protein